MTTISVKKNYIKGIVNFINSEITIDFNKQKKETCFTNEQKFKFITDGKAKLIDIYKLYETEAYKISHFEALLNCYEYEETKAQKRNNHFNSQIDQECKILKQKVTHIGNHLIDKIILGVINQEGITVELDKLRKCNQIKGE